MSTTGHETEAINVKGLKASLQKLKTDKIDSNANKGVVNEATCSTAAGTAAKTVTKPTSFSLVSGATIIVTFTNGISVGNATLAVGNTAAKPINYKGAALGANLVTAGTALVLRYDGTSYNVVGDLNTDTTYSTMVASGSTHAGGLVPDTPSTAGTTKFLREDGTWNEPAGSIPSQTGNNGKFLTTNGSAVSWADIPSDNTKTDKLPMTGAGAATENNFMAIDANGNIKDSGKNENSFQLKVTDCAMLGGGYVTCSTAGGTAAKTVTISNFLLLPNCRISVLFTNAFTATNPTLSINGGPAIAIMHFGRAMEVGKVRANTILTMVYDGTYWQVIGSESLAGSAPSGFVDLGLPSGLLWCEHNIGATTPYEGGLYFSWGNVEGHAKDSGYNFSQAVYNGTTGAALTGNIPVNNTYDAARHNMGAPCRLPTKDELTELITYCTSEWTDENGVIGRRFISSINGNSIFFPASGYWLNTSIGNIGLAYYIWSSSFSSSQNAFCINSASEYVIVSELTRYWGITARAVQ